MHDSVVMKNVPFSFEVTRTFPFSGILNFGGRLDLIHFDEFFLRSELFIFFSISGVTLEVT